MKKTFTLIITLLVTVVVFAQVAPNKYWIRFTDKNDSPYSISNPEAFLSSKSIERRVKQQIPIVENDLPVNPPYVEGVVDIGVTLLNTSKWFNSVTVYTTDPTKITQIEALPYVLSVEKSTGKHNISGDKFEKPFFENESVASIPQEAMLKSGTAGKSFDYGQAFNQISMLNGIALHDMGYDGTGMTIAVLDAGFLHVDELDAFDSLWNNGQILGYKDFVNPQNPDIFGSHYHGAMVLSTMGANLPGQMVGTAPHADYWLLRSEDGDSEYLIEELNWVSAAEFADSVGADVINSSLGYTVFDDPSMNHTYEDMDGNTTPITIGADKAVSKGMIVVNSAGNSGNDPWQYIGAPADGDSVFSIGAVNSSGNYASFSSTGPTADGRIKPNVVAQGSGSTVIDPYSGMVSSGSGTSFSSPITAGMVACLWQANYTERNTDIMDAIEESGSLADNPNNNLGYGIPDYLEAHLMIATSIDSEIVKNYNMDVVPSPFADKLIIRPGASEVQIGAVYISDIMGRIVFRKDYNVQLKVYNKLKVTGLNNLRSGVYFVSIENNGTRETHRVIKK